MIHAERVPSRAGMQTRRRRSRVRAVRAMAAEIAWLDGRLRWRDDRIVWETERGQTVPGVAELALAQRRLTRIASYPLVADQVFGDGQAWLAQRLRRLELAKQVRALSAPDLDTLASQALSGDAASTERLAMLLVAEALVLDPLPISPAAILARGGQRSELPLGALLDDPRAPMAGRALAALALGAVHRNLADAARRRSGWTRADAWPRRAYEWGLRHGVSTHPSLTVALLSEHDGAELARRCLAALRDARHFGLPSEQLRELLGREVGAERVVRLAEALADAEPLARRVLDLSAVPRPRSWDRRPQRAERLQLLSHLAESVRTIACATADPAVIPLAVRFAHATFDLGDLTPALTRALLEVLRSVVGLPPRLRRPYLEILAERHDRFWNRATLPADAAQASAWLERRVTAHILPLARLLRELDDPVLVRQAEALVVPLLLSRRAWREPEHARWALRVMGVLASDQVPQPWMLNRICNAIGRLGSAAAARVALPPLIDALSAVPPPERAELVDALLLQAELAGLPARDALPQVARHLGQIRPFAERVRARGGSGWQLGVALIGAVLRLDRGDPQRATACLGWMCDSLLASPARQETLRAVPWWIGQAAMLAISLASDDADRFQDVFRVALDHVARDDWHLVDDGLAALTRYPALVAPMGTLYARQPRRCAVLLRRLGLTSRLEPEARAPLDALRAAAESPRPDAIPLEWSGLLALAPALAPLVLDYVRAQQVNGEDPRPPAGVRRALRQPEAFERELAHLEMQLNRPAPRPDLARRVANLRARLADRERQADEALREAGERLAWIAAEAKLVAAERQVLACYRRRLERMAGPLATSLRLDDDLLNAVLLTVDVRINRRLLLRLLRARVRGEPDWRAHHPANVAFLTELTARGVDAVGWLERRPRGYHLPGPGGDRVRLHLETDPLRILQMGNYFDTCLSFGEFNSFSTIANACELNKRVIYATDGRGGIVGRQLIGINQEGALVGFRTYTNLPTESESATLRSIFRRYATDLAAQCRLTLADQGTVPLLFATEWYDDGVVAWDAEHAATHRGSAVRPGQTSERPGSPPREAALAPR